MTLRAYIEIAAVFILASAFALYTAHERRVGEDRVRVADAKAEQEARKNAEAETKLNSERATKADEQAAIAQQAIDSYRAAHPIEQPVRLCHATPAGHLPAASTPTGGAQTASAEPAPLSPVPDGTAGPDLRAGLDAIVSVAEQLAIRLAEYQQRQPVK